MNRYLSLVYFLGAFFYFSSCESYNESTEKIHKSDKPIVLTSFYPKEGGARDKILLDGENFGNDVSKMSEKELAYIRNKQNQGVFQQRQSLRRFIQWKPHLCYCPPPSGR